MKKIAVVCANGKAGKLIVDEAVERGLDVTAVVRSENQTKAQHVLQKDLYDLTTEDLEQYDAVVDAFGAWTEGEKTGEYILGGEELTLNERGESIISYADYAVATVDEITEGSHIRERISVVRK